MGHPAAFDLAEQLMEYTNHRFGHVFYTNSGSESVDTALKIALAITRRAVKPAAPV
jgi:beta-alanine--pyruvate transaminase